MPDRDLLVIGGGPGGYVAAIRAAQLGLKTTLVEKERLGGLCLNWGCIPSKALLAAADTLNLVRRSHEFGVSYDNLSADLSVAVDRSRGIVERFVGGVETLLATHGVEVIHATARLTGNSSAVIEPSGDRLEAGNIILATGASTRHLPGLTPDGDRVITSREALALRETPRSILIVGGGAIGVEFGYLYRSFGAEVTIIEALPRLLPAEDEEISRQLERSFTAQGIRVLTSSRVTASQLQASGVAVDIETPDGAATLTAERVLLGVGFEASADTMGLAEAGVAVNNGWVVIDDYGRTSAPGVWAVGDMTGRMLLAHVASQQGVTAVEKIAGLEPPPLDYETMPRAVYCRPQVAAFGLTEEEARRRGMDVITGRFPFAASGKAVATGHAEGFVKVVIDRATDAITGCHIIGHDATELLAEAGVLRTLEATTAELAHTVHAHPTLSEAIKEAALAATGEAIHFFTPRRG